MDISVKEIVMSKSTPDENNKPKNSKNRCSLVHNSDRSPLLSQKWSQQLEPQVRPLLQITQCCLIAYPASQHPSLHILAHSSRSPLLSWRPCDYSRFQVRPHQNHLMLPQSLPSFLNSAHSPSYPGPQLWQKPIVLLEAMMLWTLEALCSTRTLAAKPVPQVSETLVLSESTPAPRIPSPRGNANHSNSREVTLLDLRTHQPPDPQAPQDRRPEKKGKQGTKQPFIKDNLRNRHLNQ